MERPAKGGGRGRRGALCRGLAAMAAALLAAGCTTTIVPPADVREPTAVFVLDHGRHTSLVLPGPEGIVRYAYGDRGWYAHMRTGVLEGVAALLWPTPAVLGRRALPGPVTPAGVRRAVEPGILALHPVRVDAHKAESLRRELDGLYLAASGERIDNAAYQLTFVPHPEPYSLLRNSNHKIGEWLGRLGCTLRGGAWWAEWRVVEPRAQ